MGLIEEFIAQYRREFDYYDQIARLGAQALDFEPPSPGHPVHGHIPREITITPGSQGTTAREKQDICNPRGYLSGHC